MTYQQFYKELNTINALRKHRMRITKMVLDNHVLYNHLIKIAFKVDDPVSLKACWILELVYLDNSQMIIPYLDLFTSKLKLLKFDSSKRPIAKICQLLVEAYFKKKPSLIQNALTNTHLEQITEACFDWLIQQEKVATKAYSMYALLHLGKKYDWVYSELRPVIEKDYNSGSPAYKAAARKVLKRISN